MEATSYSRVEVEGAYGCDFGQRRGQKVMANQIAIRGRIIEALKARGYTDAEAWQMLRRVQRGDRIPDPPDQDAINAAYHRGRAGGRKEMQQMIYYYQRIQQGGWQTQEPYELYRRWHNQTMMAGYKYQPGSFFEVDDIKWQRP